MNRSGSPGAPLSKNKGRPEFPDGLCLRGALSLRPVLPAFLSDQREVPVFRQVDKRPDALGGYQVIVLHAAAAQVAEINTGLDRDDLAFFEEDVGLFADIGVLVNIQADPVTDPVVEGVTGSFNLYPAVE